jgi:hypothetical protein
MGSMSIDKYTVAVSRNRKDIPGWSRQMVLKAPLGGSDSFKTITIYFFEEHDPNDLGHQVPSTGAGTVTVYPQFRDFDHMYHLLQNEKPLSARWDNFSDNKLGYFELYTGNEPPGEGPRDLSA